MHGETLKYLTHVLTLQELRYFTKYVYTPLIGCILL